MNLKALSKALHGMTKHAPRTRAYGGAVRRSVAMWFAPAHAGGKRAGQASTVGAAKVVHMVGLCTRKKALRQWGDFNPASDTLIASTDALTTALLHGTHGDPAVYVEVPLAVLRAVLNECEGDTVRIGVVRRVSDVPDVTTRTASGKVGDAFVPLSALVVLDSNEKDCVVCASGVVTTINSLPVERHWAVARTPVAAPADALVQRVEAALAKAKHSKPQSTPADDEEEL
mgnify:CR=1 FL=1